MRQPYTTTLDIELDAESGTEAYTEIIIILDRLMHDCKITGYWISGTKLGDLDDSVN